MRAAPEEESWISIEGARGKARKGEAGEAVRPVGREGEQGRGGGGDQGDGEATVTWQESGFAEGGEEVAGRGEGVEGFVEDIGGEE